MSGDMLPDVYRAKLIIMRAQLLQGYGEQRGDLERKLGVELSFEDWLIVQVVMMQVLGPPSGGSAH